MRWVISAVKQLVIYQYTWLESIINHRDPVHRLKATRQYWWGFFERRFRYFLVFDTTSPLIAFFEEYSEGKHRSPKLIKLYCSAIHNHWRIPCSQPVPCICILSSHYLDQWSNHGLYYSQMVQDRPQLQELQTLILLASFKLGNLGVRWIHWMLTKSPNWPSVISIQSCLL